MKIIDDNGFVWALMNGKIQCLEGLADAETPEDIAENGYWAEDWHEALEILNDGGYIDLKKETP